MLNYFMQHPGFIRIGDCDSFDLTGDIKSLKRILSRINIFYSHNGVFKRVLFHTYKNKSERFIIAVGDKYFPVQADNLLVVSVDEYFLITPLFQEGFNLNVIENNNQCFDVPSAKRLIESL